MRDYSKEITSLYSLFDHSCIIREYICRGYSIERKQPFYGGFYNKYTFALKNGQEITFTRREIDADANLINQIASVIRKFDLLLDFCSGRIITDYLSYFLLDDNFSGEFNYPDGMNFHFWLHPSCKGDNYENELFLKQIGDDTCLRAFCSDSRRLSFPHSLLMRNPSGKMTMFLYNESSSVFFIFPLKIFPVEQLDNFFDVITLISELYYRGTTLYKRKANFKKSSTNKHVLPPLPEYHHLDTDLLPGDNVQHATFGEGIVKEIIKVKGHVVVDFLNIGEKTIALHSGKLQKKENDEKKNNSCGK